jgi:hypothetical protein
MFQVQMRYRTTRGTPVDPWTSITGLLETREEADDIVSQMEADCDENAPQWLREEFRVIEVQ